jgi:hypothetical protein
LKTNTVSKYWLLKSTSSLWTRTILVDDNTKEKHILAALAPNYMEALVDVGELGRSTGNRYCSRLARCSVTSKHPYGLFAMSMWRVTDMHKVENYRWFGCQSFLRKCENILAFRCTTARLCFVYSFVTTRPRH